MSIGSSPNHLQDYSCRLRNSETLAWYSRTCSCAGRNGSVVNVRTGNGVLVQFPIKVKFVWNLYVLHNIDMRLRNHCSLRNRISLVWVCSLVYRSSTTTAPYNVRKCGLFTYSNLFLIFYVLLISQKLLNIICVTFFKVCLKKSYSKLKWTRYNHQRKKFFK